ncbi:hypothetical protein C0Q70_14419 [Pomacea canaliculata]|uniref:Uncharacterized protein n=1 Tax=Pomacea canaliculata TaxID=400727 RepID=A0A2T7P002_POMCA|nr:hypothetical protein C0Q70_14419 [Pomacea canaliculata]
MATDAKQGCHVNKATDSVVFLLEEREREQCGLATPTSIAGPWCSQQHQQDGDHGSDSDRYSCGTSPADTRSAGAALLQSPQYRLPLARTPGGSFKLASAQIARLHLVFVCSCNTVPAQ